MYVSLEDKGEVVVVDMAALKVTARYPLAPAKTPTGLAMDPKNRLLFSGCRSGHLVVLGADTGKIVATLPIGQGCDAVAFDPARPRLQQQP